MGSPENPNQLMIASEPEAAAISVKRKISVIFRRNNYFGIISQVLSNSAVNSF